MWSEGEPARSTCSGVGGSADVHPSPNLRGIRGDALTGNPGIDLEQLAARTRRTEALPSSEIEGVAVIAAANYDSSSSS